jgi:hypothetical protein
MSGEGVGVGIISNLYSHPHLPLLALFDTSKYFSIIEVRLFHLAVMGDR